MEIAADVLGWVSTAVLALIVCVAVLDHVRHGGRPRLWLALSLALIATVGITGRVNNDILAEPSRLVLDARILLFAASGFAVLEHRFATLGPPRRIVRIAIGAITAGAAAAAVAVRLPLEPGARVTGPQMGAILAVALVWSGSIFEPTVRFWLAGSGLSAAERGRLRLRSAGLAGIALMLLSAIALVGRQPPAARPSVGMHVIALGLLGVVFLAVAPPAVLRRHWLQREAMRRAADLGPVGAWYWDVPSGAVAWSKQLYAIFGRASGGALGFEDYLAAVHPDDRAWIEDLMRERFVSQEPFEFDHRIDDPDGVTRWVHCVGQVVRDPGTGETVAMYGTAHDVTERRNAEDAVRRSGQHFRALVDSAPDAAVVVDGTGRIVLVNDEATRLFGYSSDELVGSTVDILVPEAMAAAHASLRGIYNERPRRRTMAGGRDLFARRRDGTLIEVDVSLSPVQTEDGRLVIAAVRDATERRQAERRMQEAYEREKAAAEELRRVDAMKNAFLEAVSHELRTPLTAVLGFGHTLERSEMLATDEGRDIAHRIVANAKRLDRLLSDLLDLDRITRGIVDPVRRWTDLSVLARTTLENVELGGREVELSLPEVYADVSAPHVERVIENLLVNAARHTPPDARLWLKVEHVVGGALVSVEDDGSGIPDRLKDGIFEPFARGEGGVARARGSGIGLALVRRFTELHGGRAWVEDREGGGSAFRVFFPDHADAGSHDPARPHAVA